jgi:hypothetical protein
MTTKLVVLGLPDRQQGEAVFDLVTDRLTKEQLLQGPRGTPSAGYLRPTVIQTNLNHDDQEALAKALQS